MATRSGADGVLRGLDVLEALAGLQQPASLAHIAARCGLNETATYRTLRRLQQQGYVDHFPRAGYRLGSRSIALAVMIGPDPPLLRATYPIVARLVSLTGHSCAMHLRSGAYRVLTVGIPSRSHPLQDQVALGERAPLTSGSSGLVILAHLPTQEIHAVLASRPTTEHLPDDGDLARIRRDGYSVTRSHNHTAMVGISAPLLDPDTQDPLGSLSIAARAEDTSEAELVGTASQLLAATGDLGPQLAALLGPGTATSRRGVDVTVRRQDRPHH